MEYRYFSGKHESKFRTLSGDLQRAIETQVNIDLEARKISKYLGKSYASPSVQDYFFNERCEKYANASEDELKKLKILESKALYYHPLTKDRMNYYQSRAIELSKSIDIDTKYKMIEHFKDFEKYER